MLTAKGSFPFTYLGLPLGLTMLQVEDFWPLVNKCERSLTSTTVFLSQAGQLELTNSMFSALPTFFMCTSRLPKTVIKQIDKFCIHYLWRGEDFHSHKPAKATWAMVCTPKKGG